MSDSDIGDQLLELAGMKDKKRKKRQGSSSNPAPKRRKAESPVDSDVEDDAPESEEDDSNPYPLEGKFIDDTDRQRLMQMSEVDREDILSQRQDEMQRIIDKRNLDQMFKTRNADTADSVSKAAKRHHSVRGATKEKTRKLDELKAKRKAKDEKKRNRANSPKRDRSSSPMDMETSTEDEEDGQISKFEQEEEREKKLLDSRSKRSADDEPMSIEDLNKCRLTRDDLTKYYLTPYFEELVKGAWVRYLINSIPGQTENTYRICEIIGVENATVPYQMNDRKTHHTLVLKHGKSSRPCNMDKVSNGAITQREFERIEAVGKSEGVKLPSKGQLQKKVSEIQKLASQPMTETLFAEMLEKRKVLEANKFSGAAVTLEKSLLTQRRTLALRREEFAEVAELDKQLADLVSASASVQIQRSDEEPEDRLAKVNERNRKANMEAVRKAEAAEAERRRRERKLAMNGGTTTPVDTSARVKIAPRVFNQTSRSGTPNPHGTPSLKAQDVTRPISPFPPLAKSAHTPAGKQFETSMAYSIELDLGDF